MSLPDALARDPGSRGFFAALARFDALPVEKVLVWRVASTDALTRQHVAEALGLSGLDLSVGDPIVAIARGIELMRAQGTVAALRVGLAALGHPSAEIEEDTVRRYDGRIRYDGMYRYGADAHWSAFVVYLDFGAPPTLDALRAAWTLVQSWKPERSPASLGVRVAGELVKMWRVQPVEDD